jgi:hypothetical protein
MNTYTLRKRIFASQDDNIEIIIKRFDEVDKKLSNVEEALRRNDVHISFVTKLYLMFKGPIMNIFRSSGLIKEPERQILDVV